MRCICAVMFLLTFCLPVPALPIHLKRPHPIGYARHHKLFLITSAMFLAAGVADTETTIHGEERCPTCTEANRLYGPYPSAARLWLVGMGLNAAVVGFNCYELRPQEPWSADEKRSDRALYIFTRLEKPLTVAFVGGATAVHIHSAYQNAQIRKSPL